MFEKALKLPNLRILAIVENSIDQDILASLLIMFSCDFEIFDNDHQAMEQHEKNPFDVILVDKSQYSFAYEGIDNQHPYAMLYNTPVIFIGSGQSHKKSFWHNNQSRLEKPLKVKALEKALLNFVSKKMFMP